MMTTDARLGYSLESDGRLGGTLGSRSGASSRSSSRGRSSLRSRPFSRRAVCALAGVAAAAILLVPPSADAQLRLIAPLDAGEPISYYIADGAPGSAYVESDRELAVWALEAWQKASGGALEFVESGEDDALIRIYFVQASGGQYGEMRPILVDGRRGAEVFVRPDVRALGPDIAAAASQDPLLRDSIVYLTCVHELGHALGLEHTDDFDDIMYFFGYGGSIPQFFGRYRERLATRDDIANESGLSAGDIARLAALYAGRADASGR